MGTRAEDDTCSSNVAVIGELYRAFVNHNIEVILAMISPDVEWGEPDNPFNPSAGTRHGLAGFLEWLRVGRQSEDILVVEPRQFLTNHDTVAVVGYTKCRAKVTGRIYETDFVHLITLRNGKVTRFQEFFDTYATAEAFRP